MISDPRHIAVFTTGGTIDSRHEATMDGKTVPVTVSLIGPYLRNLKPHFSFEVQSICVKDSREITEGDRHALLLAIKETGARYNLVTHGTYTMSDTARYLSEHLEDIPNSVVVLTGSMATLIGSVDAEGRLLASDAPFNLGFAIAEALHAEPGVYVAMNGRLFAATDVIKNIKEGRFEPSDSQ